MPSDKAMQERPILFSGPMVRAILEGRKTQTRRVVKDETMLSWLNCDNVVKPINDHIAHLGCPYGQPGDRLWVRETFCTGYKYEDECPVLDENDEMIEDVWYRASTPEMNWYEDGKQVNVPWKPSIHMPRRLSRITLEIVSVRVERLQDISEADAMAEGLAKATKDGDLWKVGLDSWPWTDWVWGAKASINAYAKLWETINGPGSWNANPWVWVIEFKRVEA